ncbi:MAG: ATP-dependent sacrificial sulfur transferase LarE [Pseudomonadota bacterium]
MTVDEKIKDLTRILRDMGSVLVAFSGGCDSTFLLKAAHDTLGDRAVALTASSPTYPDSELNQAGLLAKEIGARHVTLDSNELEIPQFSDNTPRRCYFCKTELFKLCVKEARKLGLACVADASNTDDLNDYRPGRDAARELGIRSPLIEACLDKSDIREASRKLGLRTWDKPAMACLASRFPYGTEITQEKLDRIARCEQRLGALGFRVFRVRYHDETARIEVGREEMSRFGDEDMRDRIVALFRQEGFVYVTLDLAGYRTGSMNETLDKKCTPL